MTTLLFWVLGSVVTFAAVLFLIYLALLLDYLGDWVRAIAVELHEIKNRMDEK